MFSVMCITFLDRNQKLYLIPEVEKGVDSRKTSEIQSSVKFLSLAHKMIRFTQHYDHSCPSKIASASFQTEIVHKFEFQIF